LGDLLYFFNLDKHEYFGHCHKETEWRLNSASMIPLIDLVHHYGRWAGDRIILAPIIFLERQQEKFEDISVEVYAS